MAGDRFFIQNRNDYTNTVILDACEKYGQSTDLVPLNYKGEKALAYEVTPDYLRFLAESKPGNEGLDCRVFKKDRFGQVQLWRLQDRDIRKKAKTSRLARQKIKTGKQTAA